MSGAVVADALITGPAVQYFFYALAVPAGLLVTLIIRTSPRSHFRLSRFETAVGPWLWTRHKSRKTVALAAIVGAGAVMCVVANFFPIVTFTSQPLFPGDPFAGPMEHDPTAGALGLALGIVVGLLAVRRAVGGEGITVPISLFLATVLELVAVLADYLSNDKVISSRFAPVVSAGPGLIVLLIGSAIAWTGCAADLVTGLRTPLRLIGQQSPSLGPPLDPSPPPLPPPLDPSPPPLPPSWPVPTPSDIASGRRAALSTLGALALLAIAAAGLTVFVVHHPVSSTSGQPSKHAATSPPSVTPVPAAIAEAAKQYLAAVAPVNADGGRFHAALAADAALPCSCSPGEFAIRADSLAQIPALNRDTESLQVVLQRIRYEVPGIAAGIDTVVTDNQQYMSWLAAAYRAAQSGGAGVGNDISTAEALDNASRPDFVRLRSDLGLPPPSSG